MEIMPRRVTEGMELKLETILTGILSNKQKKRQRVVSKGFWFAKKVQGT